MKAFECRECGQCCFGDGGIFLQEGEVERIAAFMKMTPEHFIASSCEKRHGRLYIRSGPDGYCMYFDQDQKCLIHPVKPGRCRQWPFFTAIVADKDNWDLAKLACPGINPDCTFEEFVKQAEE